MTDLEKHVNQPGRDKLIKRVREKIKELGITYIYFQFISVTGRVVGKGIPADHWERTAEKGFQLVYGSTANLFLDRHNNYIFMVTLNHIKTHCFCVLNNLHKHWS